jgi:hypothetical protein
MTGITMNGKVAVVSQIVDGHDVWVLAQPGHRLGFLKDALPL